MFYLKDGKKPITLFFIGKILLLLEYIVKN